MNSKINVIVVDDDQDTSDVFCEFLSIKKINVLGTGKNGKECYELFTKLNPDIVFLDVMMPEYDGFYALKKIREINPIVKIIMITADITKETKNKLFQLGATAIIYKPYEIDYVIKIIKEIYENQEKIDETKSKSFIPQI